MAKLSEKQVALTFGLFLGGLHALWSFLVALGGGQALIDFIFWAHMIHAEHTIGPFDLTASAVLVVATFAVGCVLGWVFAYLWNTLHHSA
jgi:hypothetical protein